MGIKMYIAIRMDDITPDMDYEKFLSFKELCDRYQVCPLIGVVPDNRDKMLQIDKKRADFWKYVLGLQAKGWTIAQHGVYHVYTTKKMGCFPLNRLSEFAGLPYDKQYEMLSHGKDILEKNGIKTDIFMTPAHSFDKNTLKALKNLGFTKITDGFGDMPYIKNGMTFYPISYKQSTSLKKDKGYTTFVVHSNTMDDKDFARYEKLFKENSDKLISYSELLKLKPKKRKLFENIKEYIMAFTKFVLVNVKSKISH
jgi:predicted deacetylase